MFTFFRSRFLSVSIRSQFSSFCQRLSSGFGVLGLRPLARVATQAVAVTTLAMVLWLGAAGTFAQPAQAGDNLDGRRYEAEAVRQSRNPLSNENFNGGVDPAIAAERSQAPEDQARGILGSVKDAVQDVLPGNGDANPGQNAANPNTQPNPNPNPTLKRYDSAR
ncbi:hypothetical protein IQ265_12370 [Nodosilinea sp. LEGE 06152]|uniref:hypothetical protein n=1 Tax=Nodosilinea sp. LEGE 06152 TaxID=2777966 RepID=UPI00187FCC1D|nr:hypothetical protein [Nodosilinea sp. LEGE 06152]MBE9157613.1 hypothetical protein [Nodosilinea sp. LEGE 06152]